MEFMWIISHCNPVNTNIEMNVIDQKNYRVFWVLANISTECSRLYTDLVVYFQILWLLLYAKMYMSLLCFVICYKMNVK